MLWGVTLDKEQRKISLKWLWLFFYRPNQSWLIANLFNFCVFHPIWIKLGIQTNRKKVEKIRLFDFHWKKRDSIFFFRTFAKVELFPERDGTKNMDRFFIFSLRTFVQIEPFWGRDGTSAETNTKHSFRYSGFDKSM